MTAELEPDFVLVATSVKAILFFLEIIDVDPELLTIVQHRSARPALSSHPGEIIEGAEFPDNSAAFTLAANQCRYIPFHPEIGLWIPKADMFQHRASISAVGFVSVRSGYRLRAAHGKTSLYRRLFRINAFSDKLLRRHSHA